MRTSKLFYLVCGIILSVFLVLSCKDDFSEKDFLKLQADLAAQKDSANYKNSVQQILLAAQLAKSNDSAMAVLQKMLQEELIILQTQLGRETDSLMAAKQLELLRNAGLLLSWSIQVQENRKPVSGADVTIQTADIDNLRTLTATTSTTGYVTFNDVTVGSNLLRITKTGYLTSNVAVQFEMNDLLSTGGIYIPIRRSESSVIPLFSSSTGEIATIKGTATVDTDLTNNTRELAPVGTKIKANIAEALQNANLIYPESNDPAISSTQRIMSYAVEGGENVGVGTVDASGNFSISIGLDEGTNQIVVSANDSAGNATEQDLNVIVASFQ